MTAFVRTDFESSTASRAFASRAAGAVLVAIAALALVALVTSVDQRRHTPAIAVTLEIGSERYRVDAGVLAWLEHHAQQHFADGHATARTLVAEEVSNRLDSLFGQASERVPAFADWYYSLSGEYSRLAMAALAHADLAAPDFVAGRAASMLFPDDSWGRDLAQLEHHVTNRLSAHQQRLRDGLLAELHQRLAPHRIPPPLTTASADPHAAAPLRLHTLLADIAERERAALEQRIGISTVAAGGAATGTALWRAAAVANPAAAGRAGARSVGRGAARAGTAAAGGSTFCAPAGAAAVGCGLVAGVAAWLATDWLLLRVDEYRHRDELVAAIQQGLYTLRDDVQSSLMAAYDELLRTTQSAARTEIERSFVPARAVSR